MPDRRPRSEGLCPICRSTAARSAAVYHGLSVVRCLSCGHGYVWPVPAPEYIDAIYRDKAYYEGAEDSIGFRDYASLAPARTRMFNRHLDPGPVQVERDPARADPDLQAAAGSRST